MENNNVYNNLKEVDYNIIRQIEEHAKKYDECSDKKEFLRNISPYEQKVILLNSKRPYEVLSFLDELDLENSRLVVNGLTNEEITKILELFTSEDKKNFYKFFSDLSLVNQFIKYDSNSSEHIKTLSFDRKVDILESAKKETVQSSSKIYESMSLEEQSQAIELVTDADASVALSQVIDSGVNNSLSEYNLNNELQSENLEGKTDVELVINDKELVQEEIEEETKEQEREEELKEEKEEKEESEEIEESKTEGETLINDDSENNFKEQKQFFIDNIQKYINILPELANFDANSNDVYELLSLESKKIIDSDFVENSKTKLNEVSTINHSETSNNNELAIQNLLKNFDEEKRKQEQKEIEEYTNKLVNTNFNIAVENNFENDKVDIKL